jgi:DNA-binding transcriptional regulator YhcF (GntR family)
MEFREDRAIYLQVARYVFDKILGSDWKENDRIPAIRELAIEMQVNPNTVARSYAYLQDQGIIHNERGIGYFVSDGALERCLQVRRSEFMEQELPRMLRAMDQLSITPEEIGRLYRKYKETGRLPHDPEAGNPKHTEEDR